MNTESIETDFKRKVCSEITLHSEGTNRYRVFTPFTFDDGDCLAIVLKRDQNKWLLTDEGHTLMHLSYKIDEQSMAKGTRQKIISNTLEGYSIGQRNGELIKEIENSDYGNSLFDFAQALIKISDVSYLTREKVRSAFFEDFKELIEKSVPPERRKFNWHDENQDTKSHYMVDCKVNSMETPLFLYALNGDDKVRDTTISIHHFESGGYRFKAVGIFENQEEISRKVLARFSDVCDKQFSALSGNHERISSYLQKELAQVKLD